MEHLAVRVLDPNADQFSRAPAPENVTLALHPGDVHDPTEIATYLAGFTQYMHRADDASPAILVDNTEDKFRTFDDDDAFRQVNVKGSTESAIPEVDPKSSLSTYKTVVRVVGAFVPTRTQSQTGNNYNPLFAASRRCRNAIMLDREVDTWNLLGTAGSFDASVQTAVGAGLEWDDLTGASDPIIDLQAAIEKSAQQVTDIWMNQKISHTFMRHPKVRDQMRQFFGDDATNQGRQVYTAGAPSTDISGDYTIPGLPPIHVVAGKVRNETTSALDFIMPEVVTLTHAPPGVPTDGEDIATSYTFRERQESGVGFDTRQFRVEGRGARGGDMVVVTMADVAVITGNNVGGIITNVHT